MLGPGKGNNGRARIEASSFSFTFLKILYCDYPSYSRVDPYSGAEDDGHSSKKDVLNVVFAHGKSRQNGLHCAVHRRFTLDPSLSGL